jgi:RNA polymerase sigma-70 factor, ECF subfamily
MPIVTEREQLPVAGAREGNAEAWESLFRRYRLPLYVYVFELVHDEQTSLDLVQETFISAFRHIATLREDGKFGSWLFGIAHQKCIQQWRKRDREAELREELMATPEIGGDDDPLDLLIREEQEANVMKLLAELPLPQRSVLMLRFVEGFSLEEIARITGAQLGTVKSRLHYAKGVFRELLEKQSP